MAASESPGVQPSRTIKIRNPGSVVRQHFDDLLIPIIEEPGTNKQGALCKECGAAVGQRTSSAMKKHLQKHHPDLHQQVQSKLTLLYKIFFSSLMIDDFLDQDQANYDARYRSILEQQQKAATAPKKTKAAPRIMEAPLPPSTRTRGQKRKYDEAFTKEEEEENNMCLAEWVGSSTLSINFVEHPKFRKYMAKVAPKV